METFLLYWLMTGLVVFVLCGITGIVHCSVVTTEDGKRVNKILLDLYAAGTAVFLGVSAFLAAVVVAARVAHG